MLEGPISPVEFNEEEDPGRRELWRRIRDAIAEVLDNTTLADLNSHSSDGDQDSYMFYI